MKSTLRRSRQRQCRLRRCPSPSYYHCYSNAPTAIVTTTVSQFDSERWSCKLTATRRPPPFLLPLLQQLRGCSVCLCALCTYIHTYTLPYLQLRSTLLGTHFCPIHIFPLFDLLLLFFSLSCACIFPHMHTTLYVHGAVHARPYHAYPCVLFILSHVYFLNLIILLDLISLLSLFPLSCACFFPHMHTTLHVQCAVHTCP